MSTLTRILTAVTTSTLTFMATAAITSTLTFMPMAAIMSTLYLYASCCHNEHSYLYAKSCHNEHSYLYANSCHNEHSYLYAFVTWSADEAVSFKMQTPHRPAVANQRLHWPLGVCTDVPHLGHAKISRHGHELVVHLCHSGVISHSGYAVNHCCSMQPITCSTTTKRSWNGTYLACHIMCLQVLQPTLFGVQQHFSWKWNLPSWSYYVPTGVTANIFWVSATF